jgi:guanine deaminase
MTPFRLHAPILNPVSTDMAEWHPDGVIAVGEDGTILYAGDVGNLPESLLALPASESDDVILPGFIDLHVHLPQYDCRGKFGLSLLEWLDEFVFPEEARFADVAVAKDVARRFFTALLRAGTTTAAVYSSGHTAATEVAFQEAQRSGLRIIMGKVHMDRHVPESIREDPGISLRDARMLIERWHRRTDRLWYAVTPRFAPSCSAELMRGCARLAEEYGTHIQTHINESSGEIEEVRQLFPGSASYTEVYHSAGLLTRRTILAHNIHPTDEEIDLCARSGCAVAHCPDSNLFLGSGRFPLERYRKSTIPFGLGSDVGAGTSLSMFVVMKAMSHAQQRSLHPFIPLFHATLGGARALGLEHEIGSLSTGLAADLIAVHVDRHFPHGKPFHRVNARDVASSIVYRSQPSDLKAVWIQGERLY